MNPIEHVLHRPDTYVGSVRNKEQEEYVSIKDNDFKISKKNIKFPPALLRIFIEPLSNAIDNVSRSKDTKTPCTKIKIYLDKETGKTSIWNDGECIPIEINNTENCYNHTLIFGNLLTSSNYDDEKDRYNISGRNGYGSKLCNIFSTSFKVKGLDPDNNKTFEQEWTNNMKNISKPIIKTSKLKKGYTEVTWFPDFARFNLKGYTKDIIDLYCKYIVDTAMLTNVNVYFNDSLIPVKNLKDYSKLYETVDNNDILCINTKDSNVVLMPSSQFQAVSFVNGVYTCLGGTHVDSWISAMLRPVVDKLSKPKGVSFSLGDIKKFFKIFVSVKVVNPEFESQSKNRLESPVKTLVQKKDINTILGWSVIEDIKRSKEIGVLKKLERKKKNFVRIDGLDPANNEGGKTGSDCTLILVEGLAAKTYAVKGIEVGAFGKSGRDWFGIYALRGKVLNVRNAKPASIANNNVISDIIKALGVELNMDYTKDNNYSNLRYGRILIITDSDVDGIHISGLLQNMVHTLFPSLLERNQSFVTAMQTPIVRVFLEKKKEILFYDEREYKKLLETNSFPGKVVNTKYYKGLGSSSDSDIMTTFGKKLVEFKNDENTNFNMNKVFSTKQSDSRKKWIENYNKNDIRLSWKGDTQEILNLKISDFLDTEMIKFSINDCQRSIPNMLDGLKESQRKTLYACFLRNLKYSGKTLKVAQLAGYVAEKTAYHHGEQNLHDTITRMANDYPGSNNIPLLYRDGQFGTRNNGGKDAANARYIFTKLDYLTRLLFRPEDDVLLSRIVDDGDVVEPNFYIPILPTILINGCTVGIGTGWSSAVPCYNPKDLIKLVKIWIENDGKIFDGDDDNDNDKTVISSLPEINPWYRGFTGKIEKSSENKYISWGNVVQVKKNKVVDELPIGLWTDNFKEFLDNLLENKSIKRVKNYSSPKKINFVISESQDGIDCNNKNLKLYKYIFTSNMVLFDENCRIKKYNSIDEIIDSFCKIRLSYYTKRKNHMLNILKTDIKFLGNKKRFLEEVMKGTIKLFNEKGNSRTTRKISDIVKELEFKKYDKYSNNKDQDNKSSEETDEDSENTNGYDYLLRLQFRSITEEKINKLKNDIESKIKERNTLQKTSETQIWSNDINEFEKAYDSWINIMEKNTHKTK